MIARISLLALLLIALMACSGSRQSSELAVADNSPMPPTSEQANAVTPVPVTPAEAGASKITPDSTAGTVDYSCRTDADCTIKDVGNCCGYYPACVNVDSPTFPEQVKADCDASGRVGVCGFPSITGCQCVDGRCEGIQGMAVGPAETK